MRLEYFIIFFLNIFVIPFFALSWLSCTAGSCCIIRPARFMCAFDCFIHHCRCRSIGEERLNGKWIDWNAFHCCQDEKGSLLCVVCMKMQKLWVCGVFNWKVQYLVLEWGSQSKDTSFFLTKMKFLILYFLFSFIFE